MENVKFIKEWWYTTGEEEYNGIYTSMSDLQHLLCDVIEPHEKATFKRAIKNGGFVTFGDDGMHACIKPTKENIQKFFKKHFNLDYQGEEQ